MLGWWQLTVETMIYRELVDDAGVGALCGDRIYPLVVPQDAARPFVMYERLAGELAYSHDGPDAIQTVGMRLMIGAESYASAAAVDLAIRSALDVPVTGDGSTGVYAVLFGQADDGYEHESGLYSRTVMIDVVYQYAVGD